MFTLGPWVCNAGDGGKIIWGSIWQHMAHTRFLVRHVRRRLSQALWCWRLVA